MGRLSAKERLSALLDRRSFREIDGQPLEAPEPPSVGERTDGVLAGLGKVNGRKVAVFVQDSSYMGGSLGAAHIAKIRKTVREGARLGIPIVGLYDSAGARMQDGIVSLAEVGGLLRTVSSARSRAPMISAVMGHVTGGSAYAAAFGHVLLMVDEGSVSVWGPGVAKAEKGEEVTIEELGGVQVHMRRSGLASAKAGDDLECIGMVKRLLSYLPDRPGREAARVRWKAPQARILDTEREYDALDLISSVFDDESFFELQPAWGRSFVVGLARLEGRTVGIVASQPSEKGGYLDVSAAAKVSRLVETCNTFRVPLVTFLDSQGPEPGAAQEGRGLIRSSGRMIEAYSSPGARKVTVLVGRAFGGAYVAMASKPLGIYRVLAYPTAKVAVMGTGAYIEIFGRRRLQGLPAGEKARAAEEMSRRYEEGMDPRAGVKLGYIDVVIPPEQTRSFLVKSLRRKGPG